MRQMGKGHHHRGRTVVLAALAATIAAASPADAKKKDPPPPAPVAAPQVALPNSPNGLAVRYFYERRNYAPVWFKAGAGDEAIGQLVVMESGPEWGQTSRPRVIENKRPSVPRGRPCR